jgi:pyruvate/2-oxoglutarate dehydrogenase complex dihydrolipoamide dehydrogenase (E3) component
MLETAIVEKIANLALQAVAIEWKNQGHNLTGNAIQQLETRIIAGGDIIIQGYVVDYMANLNAGVTAANIPYSPGSGARSSKYIAGLIEYAKRRMLVGDREAKAIAFAIASRHKREGLPTKASSRFSKSGKRTGFIEIALDDIEPKLAALIEQGVEESINFVLESFFKTQINR